MAPFIGKPFGLSPDALKLLDRALNNIWRDEQLKNRLAASDKRSPRTGRPALEKPIGAKREV